MEHTKGPWETGPTQLGKISSIFRRGAGEVCSRPSGSSNAAKNWPANARLIAAAPELLDACINAHDALLSLHVCNLDKSFADEIRMLLKAEINKATGD